MKQMLIAVVASMLLAAPVALAQTIEEKAPSAQATRGAYKADEFIEKAGSGGMFEVQSSELALQKATDAKIKEFARRMVVDHKVSNDKLKSTLQSAQLPPPAGLDKKHKEMMDELQAAGPGREFDRAYLEAQVKAHKEAVELFWTYAREGDHPELRTFAQQALPTLEDHFKHVQNLEGVPPASTGSSK
jgi:putative membrane protein